MSTRLPGAKYKRVFDRGRSVKGRLFAAWAFASDDADRMAGVVVSKKTFHDAVDRNRSKRLLREAYRLLVKAGEMPARTEWVFVARRGILEKACCEVMDEMRWAARKVARCAREEGHAEGSSDPARQGVPGRAESASGRGVPV